MSTPWEILIIEDDAIDRMLAAELLNVRGRGRIRVTEARDLRTGLDLLSRQPFDLVLLDTKLPEATALYALRAVGEKAPLTPILPHTSYITVQMRQLARQQGAFDVVVRGDLNPMWTSASKLLSLDTLEAERRPAAQAG